MKLGILIFLTCAMLAVSACVVEPYRDDRRGGDHDGRHHRNNQHDYGRGVWHQ